MAQKQARKKSAPQRSSGSAKLTIGVIAVGLLLTVGAVLFGRTDEGMIDVARMVNQSNATADATNNPENRANNPASNSRSNEPNGGLVGTGKSERVQSEPEPDVEGASTTPSAASTTPSDGESAEDGAEITEDEEVEETGEREATSTEAAAQ